MTDFAGKVVWITGASSGIGEALAYELAGQGAQLVLSARRRERLEAVRARCAHPEDHRVLAFDIADTASHAEQVARVLDEVGRIDVLINNAGVSQRALVKETALEVDRRLFEVDYFGPVSLIKLVLPQMLQQKSGSIVAVSSVAGLVATPYRSSYAAAKAALLAFHDALRAETAQDGIQVSVLCPGFVATEIAQAALVGDGSASAGRHTVPKGALSAQSFARKAVARLRAGEGLIVIGGAKEKAAWWLARFSPALTAKLMTRVKVI
ncbi:MAG TPA: SDR family oxidoreductase [Polyangiales bacterium]|nr:SDR family oxidoreductase [Polyangiales bacterium]